MTTDDRLRAAAEEYFKSTARFKYSKLSTDSLNDFLAGAKYERDRAEVLLEAAQTLHELACSNLLDRKNVSPYWGEKWDEAFKAIAAYRDGT